MTLIANCAYCSDCGRSGLHLRSGAVRLRRLAWEEALCLIGPRTAAVRDTAGDRPPPVYRQKAVLTAAPPVRTSCAFHMGLEEERGRRDRIANCEGVHCHAPATQ